MKRILFAIPAAAALLAGCQKMPSNIDADGNLLVATSYDSEADFSGYTTFSVADSIFIIDSYMRGQLVKNAFTDALTDEFRQMMESCGYEFVPIEDNTGDDTGSGSGTDTGSGGDTGSGSGDDTGTTGGQAADLGIQLTYSYDTEYYVDYVDPYWWLDYSGYWSPYWSGAWYYPYPVTYELSTHSLMADMADLTATGDDNESHPIIWNCVINGASGSGMSDLAKFKAAIRQAFAQSEYLKKVSE